MKLMNEPETPQLKGRALIDRLADSTVTSFTETARLAQAEGTPPPTLWDQAHAVVRQEASTRRIHPQTVYTDLASQARGRSILFDPDVQAKLTANRVLTGRNREARYFGDCATLVEAAALRQRPELAERDRNRINPK